MAERAEDSSGLGGCCEEGGHVGVVQEVFELAGAAADVVVSGAGEPGAAGGEVRFRAGGVRLSGAGVAGGGQGVGLPAGEEVVETVGGTGDAVIGEAEYGRLGGVYVWAEG